ncbi:hypothetical protein HaLaN_22003 [Haematococcus lacustris]|uniref:Uncharacterized protein n=1 Tax=Haematococcus lacustris TaxID=44745 RepID=A0A699ZZG5_HAELA|nr:hypothetical protein HaLaN_22003 [Haematococcus lacustris]
MQQQQPAGSGNSVGGRCPCHAHGRADDGGASSGHHTGQGLLPMALPRWVAVLQLPPCQTKLSSGIAESALGASRRLMDQPAGQT